MATKFNARLGLSVGNTVSVVDANGAITANGLTVNGAVTAGNTGITGFINVSSTANVGGIANFRNNVIANGTLTVANTIAAGNTTVTGFINVSTTANIGDVLTARANVVANGQLIVANTASLGNTTVTGFINVSTTANVGGIANFRSNVVANGTLTVANAASVGNLSATNTDITGYINVGSTANVGGIANFRNNVIANGTLTVANAASTGNATVTGFLNVSSTANIGGTLNARSDLVVNGTLTVANSATIGNVTVGTIVGGNSNITGSAFILGAAASFNANTGVNNLTNFITTTALHGFSNGDYVQYLVAAGNTAGTNLANASYYYITNANTTAFTLSSTYGGAAISLLASSVSETGHTFVPRRVAIGQDGSISTSIGLANVASLRVLGDANMNGALTVSNTVSAGNLVATNTDITGYINVSSTANVGGVANFRNNVIANGTLTVVNSAALGNTTITGSINVSTTANVGGVANFRNNVIANGTLTVVNTAALGNTTITGFANVSTTLQVGANVVLGTTTISANGGVGSAGQVLTSGAAGNVYWSTVAAGSAAGGTDTQVQFNDGGSALGGDAGLTYNKTTDTLTVSGVVSVGANVFANTTAVDVGNTIITSAQLTLGGNINANGGVGTSGQVLTSSATGNAYWSTVTAGATPGGTDTQVQFNDGGSALGGDAGLTYNKTTDALTVAGSVGVGANVIANTSAVLIGNSTVNNIITSSSIAFRGTLSANGGVGSSGQVLTSGAAGNVYWAAAPATSAGGSNAQIQFNDGGTAFGGDAGLTYNKTTDTLTAAGAVSVGANVIANTSALLVGNSSVNTIVNSTSISVNTTNPSVLTVGNSSVNSTLTSTALTVRDATISGNLTVSGTTTYINTTTLNVGDNIVTLNADLTGATAPSENAGIEINRGSSANVQFVWDEGNDRWAAGNVAFANTEITGYVNVSSTANVGGIANFRANVIANGTLTVSNAAAVGNTTITGFANVSDTLQVGANVVLGTTTISANGGVGTSGQVLTSGASGNVYWSTVSAGASLPTTISLQNTTATATASGANAVAVGANAQATANISIAIGANTMANGTQESIAIGYNSYAGNNSIVVGSNNRTTASGPGRSILIGWDIAGSSHNAAIAIGANSGIGGGGGNISIGQNSRAINAPAVAMGQSSSADGSSVAIGPNAKAVSTSTALGASANASATGSVSAGYLANATINSVAIGMGASVTGNNSFAIGANNTVSGAFSGALGYGISVSTANTIQIGTSTQTVALPGTITANGGVGSAGQVLTSGAAGNVYWATVASGSATPSGSDTQVQFNDGGTAFGGDAGLTYNKTTDTLTVAGAVSVGANVIANTSALFVGNSTVNTVVSSNSAIMGGDVRVTSNSAVHLGGNTSVSKYYIQYNSVSNSIDFVLT